MRRKLLTLDRSQWDGLSPVRWLQMQGGTTIARSDREESNGDGAIEAVH